MFVIIEEIDFLFTNNNQPPSYEPVQAECSLLLVISHKTLLEICANNTVVVINAPDIV